MVGRFVQQQGRRSAKERLRQQHANLLSALQFAHGALVQVVAFQAQSIEQHGGIGFRRVAALFADDAFEFAQAHAFLVGQLVVRFGVERVALLESLPQRGIAHDDGVNDAELVEGKLVLPQDAEFLRPRDRTLGRLDLLGQDLHKSGLAGAIGPGDGVAAPGHKATGDVLKETPLAEAHRDVIDGKQSQPLYQVIAARACGLWKR